MKSYVYAGLWLRMRAFAFDYLIIAAYLFLLVVCAVVARWGWPGLIQTLFARPAMSHLVSFLLVTLPVSLYFALSEASARQATWGKHKLGLQVIRADGARLRLGRSLGRTALKFIPWELSHALIWYGRFAGEEEGTLLNVGILLVWVLVGVNLVSLLITQTHRTLYDWLAGTNVVQRRA